MFEIPDCTDRNEAEENFRVPSCVDATRCASPVPKDEKGGVCSLSMMAEKNREASDRSSIPATLLNKSEGCKKPCTEVQGREWGKSPANTSRETGRRNVLNLMCLNTLTFNQSR